jgi:hypothetical protein
MLWLERLAADVVQRLRDEGIRAILIKGAALKRLLYGDGEPRPYGDVDLLVSPADHARTESILAKLGFTKYVDDADYPGHEPLHALPWTRGDASKPLVDLHTTLAGAMADRSAVWDTLREETDRLEVGGVEVEVLTPTGNALHVALHAAHHGRAARTPMVDLERALALLEPSVWERASVLASRIDATEAFAAGLRLNPDGAAVADRLHLSETTTLETALKARSAPRLAAGLARLGGVSGPRAKLALIARGMVPTAAWMRSRFPIARRGRLGLLAAYLWFPIWVLVHIGPALMALWRAQREARAS